MAHNVCNICEKSFLTPRNLKIHTRIHTGERPYKCETCERAFTQIGNLESHIRTHTGERPFKCDVCDKSFSRLDHVDIHKVIHTGERLFKCETCNYSFTTQTSLNIHIRVHTGERPFSCEVCDKAFKQSGDLVKHRRTHTGERPFKCHQCDQAFITSDALKSHVRTWHTTRGIARRKRQEERVKKILISQGLEFQEEVRIDFRCMKDSDEHHFAFIDVLMAYKGGWIAIEIDESQHRFGRYSVGCDMGRMARITESCAVAGNIKPFLFVRYNPGTLLRKKGKWVLNDKDIEIDGALIRRTREEREASLVEFVKTWEFPEDCDQRLFVKYLFYDTENGVPCIFEAKEYNQEIKKCVIL